MRTVIAEDKISRKINKLRENKNKMGLRGQDRKKTQTNYGKKSYEFKAIEYGLNHNIIIKILIFVVFESVGEAKVYWTWGYPLQKEREVEKNNYCR